MILRLGARGVAVEDAQRRINAYLATHRGDITPGELARAAAADPARLRPFVDKVVANGWRIGVDGDYGNLTDAAVRIVQADQDGLAVDGQTGPMTDARLAGGVVMPRDIEDPSKNGLLIAGAIVPVPGHKVIGPHDAAWSHLAPGDARKRPRKPDGSLLYPLRQWMVHKTIADDPEVLVEGKGPAGGARRTAEYWQQDPIYGGAQIVFGDDGEIACLCDLYDVEAFHATASNRYSVGSELREVGPLRGQRGGKFYRAALDANVDAIMVGAPKLGIQLQMQRRGTYTGHPIPRMDDRGGTPGGPDMIGIFGHRLNTERRGKWDPGEIVFDELAKRGVEEFDFAKREDIDVWRERQRELQREGHDLQITGIADAATVAALKASGYVDGIYALGRAA